ncbi:MAG: DUF481 domain-containing protein [Nitrospirae bacterium]|nr:DUF481 domain-containing protein [Nitrospirota bacterium]
MKLKFIIVHTFVLMLAVLYPFFAAAETTEPKRITDEAQLSYVDSQGNTRLSSLLIVNTLKYTPVDYLIATWNIEALKASSEGESTAERYTTLLRLDYLIRSRMYSFADVSWLQDEFAKIDHRYYFGAGIGYKILAGPKHMLNTEAGINYTMDTYTNHTDSDYMGGRIFGKYTYNITPTNKFEQAVEYLHDFDNSENFNVNSDTSLSAALNSMLSLKTSYKVKYDNEPVGGAKYTDRVLALSLVVNVL